MQPQPKLLVGEVVEPRDEDILNAELDRLERKIAEAQAKLREYESMAKIGEAKMRAFYLAMKSFFGDSEPSASSAAQSPNAPPNPAAWQAWKQQLPNPCGRIIDALLIQPLTQTQMVTFCKMHASTVSTSIGILDRNGLLERDGRLIKLKRI